MRYTKATQLRELKIMSEAWTAIIEERLVSKNQLPNSLQDLVSNWRDDCFFCELHRPFIYGTYTGRCSKCPLNIEYGVDCFDDKSPFAIWNELDDEETLEMGDDDLINPILILMVVDAEIMRLQLELDESGTIKRIK